MKVLTVQQPWAYLIANGYKDIENRSWSTSYRGLLAIHAGARRMSKADRQWFAGLCDDVGFHHPDSNELHYGAIVAVVRMVDVVQRHDSPWFEGPYGWVFNAYIPLHPIPAKGALGLWSADIDIERSRIALAETFDK